MRQLVIFSLNDEFYGMDIFSVNEIIKLLKIVSLPSSVSFIEGIINLRGKVVPVVDLRKRFGLPKKEYTDDTRILVADMEGHLAGFIVDEVLEVASINDDSIEPAPRALIPEAPFIEGIAKFKEKLVIMINAAKIFSFEEKQELLKVG
ncbi:chemotaxis protein CheW [Thermovenabulum gondwanense]|uniref:Chemotaxis protein CheW n=1 Tax=Thermovenabulum gondwanense TaxID=520767 RepID=A0A161PUQ0_9FIRM|nr:chemotaxis protein CheW [Thermovenabulum gondwanense]KYO66485.1 Chemotaxis protein CheW [Thermovenabulum gondwanense]